MEEITIDEYNSALENMEVIRKKILEVKYNIVTTRDENRIKELEECEKTLKIEYHKCLMVKVNYELERGKKL